MAMDLMVVGFDGRKPSGYNDQMMVGTMVSGESMVIMMVVVQL